MEKNCFCCSGKKYGQCCRPFHRGEALPLTPLELMRSRYSAYALHLTDYIMATTHPLNSAYTEDKAAWRADILHFSKITTFRKLEILEVTANTVTFTAYLSQAGKDMTFTEKSLFEKVGERWLYKEGHWK